MVNEQIGTLGQIKRGLIKSKVIKWEQKVYSAYNKYIILKIFIVKRVKKVSLF